MAVVDLAQLLAELQRDLGLSDDELSQALGVSPLTLRRWRAGASYPQTGARKQLERLAHLRDELRDLFGEAAATSAWMHSKNRSLGGFTPAEALRVGHLDRVEGALEALGLGLFV